LNTIGVVQATQSLVTFAHDVTICACFTLEDF
jgi:hypothetical protein